MDVKVAHLEEIARKMNFAIAHIGIPDHRSHFAQLKVLAEGIVPLAELLFGGFTDIGDIWRQLPFGSDAGFKFNHRDARAGNRENGTESGQGDGILTKHPFGLNLGKDFLGKNRFLDRKKKRLPIGEVKTDL